MISLKPVSTSLIADEEAILKLLPDYKDVKAGLEALERTLNLN